MNAFKFAIRRPVSTLMLVIMLTGGGVLGCSKIQVSSFPGLNTPRIYMYLGYLGLHARQMREYVVGRVESYFQKHKEEHHQENRKIVLTSPKAMDVTVTHPYVCQIHSQNHIDVCALESGYLLEILVKEGQAVKKGDLMFRLLPVLYKAKLDAELAEAHLAELEYKNTESLFKGNAVVTQVVSQNEVLLFKAKFDRAKAKAELAQAEMNFTEVRAPFDGIVDRRRQMLGSLIKEGDILTTLSDNSVMWVYFNVPERDYLEYMARPEQEKQNQKIELELANHEKFPQTGKISTIEAQFNNQTGNIPFRADFPNPDRLLRHGQTGRVLISRKLKNVLVIPQRATFEILDKRYVWVIDEDHVAHQTLITITHELDDIFVVDSGLSVQDKIVLEGVRQVQDGEKVEYEFREPELALKNQKFHAE
ncbi:MAG: efflux RND transporter periplasmic adaptor subunit [Isosphaeraceae bacterium]